MLRFAGQEKQYRCRQ